MKYTKRDIIETIVLVLISVLIVLIFLFSYSLAKERANDAKQIADLRRMQSALALYRHDTGAYPKSLEPGKPLSYGTHNYLELVPLPPKASGNCPELSNYSYSLIEDDNENIIYNIEYCLGKETAGIPAGTNIATPAGLRIK